MDSRIRVIVAVAAVGVASLAGGSARAGASTQATWLGGPGWGAAIEVPGIAALAPGGDAAITSVSCGAAGNCSAGGHYGFHPGSPATEAFVVSEVRGTWHKAIEVPGTGALNRGVQAEITSVSCASAGNCSAGGFYLDGSRRFQAFVVSEVRGTWHKAVEVPGTAALNQGGFAELGSVSCAAAGNCSAGGTYSNSSTGPQAFVVSQAGGTWHKAIEIPGTAALNQGGDDFPSEVSCGAAGNCSAGGFYIGGFGQQAFVVSQAAGAWHKAIKVPGTAALNQGGSAELGSVSCASAGHCSAGGTYADSSNKEQAFVVSQIDGTWHKAIEVPGTAALNQGGQAKIISVSCASAGHCSAGGTYADSSNVIQAFVVSQT
jgi:hypothetical protein